MKVILASHYGMCFGVRSALRTTIETASSETVTVLGQLAHNPDVRRDLEQRGIRHGELSSPPSDPSSHVVITAHGAADRDRSRLRRLGYAVTDTTCPLVRKAHFALAALVSCGFHPVVIGKADHVEVLGLVGDFPRASVVGNTGEIYSIPETTKIGIVSQTTQPIEHVNGIVQAIRDARPGSEVVFKDTVCQPTKDRQTALQHLSQSCEVVIVVGGRNSNNTRQLLKKAESLGTRAIQVETDDEIDPRWFRKIKAVGLTAGTSTPDDTVRRAYERLQRIAMGIPPAKI